MHKLTDKTYPLINKTCLLNGCTLFNEKLDGCEISILNYNLYQVKEHIRAQLAHAREMGSPIPPGNPGPPNGSSCSPPIS